MKCPYRKHVYIFRDSKGTTGSQTEYEECYKDECPHYEIYYDKEYCNKAEAQQEGRWRGGAE